MAGAVEVQGRGVHPLQESAGACRGKAAVQAECVSLRSRGEFNSGEFKAYCDKRGIKHFTMATYSPQQNGVVERRNQTVVEMVRCMLKGMAMAAVF